MDTTLLLAQLLLAAVFAVAGLAKLADHRGARQALVAFGLPLALARPGAWLLPLLELGVALALIPSVAPWWGALGALTLLLLFVGGIGYNLARGRTPDCRCFGQLHAAPVGWPTLARNVGLAAIAGLVVWQGPAQPSVGVVGWLGSLSPSQVLSLTAGILLLGLLVGEGWLLLNLLQQNGRLLLRIEALETQLGGPAPGAAIAHPVAGRPVGTRAPAFALPDLDGTRVTLAALRAAGKSVLLVFSDPGCGPCTALLPDLARWQQEHQDTLTIVLISRGTPEANRAKVAAHRLKHVLLQPDREVAQAYQVQGTPSAVLVRPDGTIGSPLASGAEAIGMLVARTTRTGGTRAPHPNGSDARPAQPVALPIGAPAPALTLPDLDGRPVALAEFQGQPTLVLFWNPSCGFCQRMLADLQAWEVNPPQQVPRLVVVSTGPVEANRALGLRAPILLDQHFTAGRQFGASGTPMAVLLDAQGRMASEVVVGAPAVLALAHDSHQLPLRPA